MSTCHQLTIRVRQPFVGAFESEGALLVQPSALSTSRAIVASYGVANGLGETASITARWGSLNVTSSSLTVGRMHAWFFVVMDVSGMYVH